MQYMHKRYLKDGTLSLNVQRHLVSSKRALVVSYDQLRTLPAYYAWRVHREEILDLLALLEVIEERVDKLLYNGEENEGFTSSPNRCNIVRK